MRRRLLTLVAAAATAVTTLAAPAAAQPAAGPEADADPVVTPTPTPTPTPIDPRASLTAVPDVEGPIPVTAESYPFSSMLHLLAPEDPAVHGFVEEEYFLSGTANVYAADDAGEISVTTPDVPYTNRILVRRPADPADATGVVLVDILNASNGYDIEDHWRRMDQWILQEGHTYVGVTAKPISVDALKLFDPDRYAPLTWDVAPGRDPVAAVPGQPFDSHQVIEGAEEGLAWDILGQLGALLTGDDAGEVLGGADAETVLLMGQSQSGIYLNTWVNRFHALAAAAGAGYDGYLSTGAAYWERPLAQDPECAGSAYASTLCLLEPREVGTDVPFITVSSEGDLGLFGTAAHRERDLPAGRTYWQVPGTLHSDPTSRLVPTNADLARAGRLARNVLSPEAAAAINTYPLDPAVIAAAQALIDHDQRALPVPPSTWFDLDADGLARDADGNGLGGLRYGLLAHPLGTYDAGLDLLSAGEFARRYGTPAEYLERMAAHDANLLDARYLTPFGAAELRAAAETFLDRITAAPAPAPAPGLQYGFFLNDGWSTTATHAFMFGRFADQVLVGDWDGDGTDSIAVRRGATYYLSNAPRGGAADTVLTYGTPGDTVLVGDWDGDGRDTLAVRRGALYHVRNSLTSGPAEQVVPYGRPGDAVVVGDWDGNGTDTFAVRRGAEYFVKNAIGAGPADAVARYGRATDVTLAGDWDGDGTDTFAVRRGATYFVKNAVAPGAADLELVYGRAGDEVLVGDWDGNGTDTLGVRRAP